MIDLTAYDELIRSKIKLHGRADGLTVDAARLHSSVFPHQRDSILWGLRKSRALLAMSFGLGKTHCQVEMMRLIHEETGGKTLIICPLGVKHQFTEEDGPRLGVRFRYVRTDAEVAACDTPFMITNYERVRDGDIQPDQFVGVSLDEGSVLRNLGSKTYQQFLQLFADTRFRYVCTATPSPNNFKEIIYYAQWLGVMDAGQALTRWFKRDSSQAGNLTLHPHHERDFWLWVSSWALFITKPSDLGYSDEGYDTPDLTVHWHRIATDHTRAWDIEDRQTGQRLLFMDSAGGVTQAAKEKRETIAERVEEAVRIIDEDAPDKHWIVWHHLEAERHAIKRALKAAVDVYGSQDLETREQRILGFAHGEYRILATKPEIAGAGCNFQHHCHANIFLGVRYQFEEFIQAVHRTHRFQQRHPVEVHVIHTDAEDEVVSVLQRKWQQHDELTQRMTAIVKTHGLIDAALRSDIDRSIGVTREEAQGQLWTAVHNDCVMELPLLDDDSVDLIHTSIPFGNQYEYSASYNDFGHNEGDEAFFEQMGHLIPELHRVLKPGRLAAIHVKDRLLYGHQTGHGTMEIDPFSDKTTTAFRRAGFVFFGRITVVTDVVRENASTYRLGWSENAKDSTKMGIGMPEYVLLFRKLQTDRSRSYGDEPVTKDKAIYTRARWQTDAHSFWRSSGDRLLAPEDLTTEVLAGMETGKVYRWFREWSRQNVYDYEAHVGVAERLEEAGRLPSAFMVFPPQAPLNGDGHVWTDVNYMLTLNTAQSQKRRENHLCPLPLDIVSRIIGRYSNEGDLVLDPFGGLMTVPVQAVKMGRRGYGIELNGDYWHWGVRYCQEAEIKRMTPTLFDLLEDEETLEMDEVAA